MDEAARQERRRLAAILAADVVGYAGLIADDETGTLTRLRALFRETVQPLVADHGGRIFRLLGDAMLAEFPSAVEALRCALALQAANAERASAEQGKAPVSLRIGIALGDVVVEGGDLYGDGVNTAARLEALAEPGGVLVSDAIAHQARGRVDCRLEDAGPLALKNIPYPVQAFRIHGGVPPVGAALIPHDRPSLAVLPFNALDSGSHDDGFADGVTEELTTALARIRWFHVIAHAFTFAYRDRPIDIRQVGRELGVRYVLEGSVRQASGRIRIAGRLIEAETGRHLWADRFEGAVEDVFALQDAVAACVTGAIEPTLERAEVDRARSRPARNQDAYNLYLRALPLRLKTTRESSEESLALLRRALELDPGFALAKAHTLVCIMQRVAQGWAAPYEQEEGAQLAKKAYAEHADDPLVLTNIADALGFLAYDPEGSLDAASRAVALNPNSCWAQSAAGWANNRVSASIVAVKHFERALCLHPHDLDVGYVYAGLGYSQLMLGRAAEALTYGQRALRQVPAMSSGHRLIIASLIELGRQEEAIAAARRFLQHVPKAVADPGYRRMYRDQTFAELLIHAFQVAGLPD